VFAPAFENEMAFGKSASSPATIANPCKRANIGNGPGLKTKDDVVFVIQSQPV
jgi:hypothetical protein